MEITMKTKITTYRTFTSEMKEFIRMTISAACNKDVKFSITNFYTKKLRMYFMFEDDEVTDEDFNKIKKCLERYCYTEEEVSSWDDKEVKSTMSFFRLLTKSHERGENERDIYRCLIDPYKVIKDMIECLFEHNIYDLKITDTIKKGSNEAEIIVENSNIRFIS